MKAGFPNKFSFFRLLFGLKKANPISTRIELGCLGLDGLLWLGKIDASAPLNFYVITRCLPSLSPRGLSGIVGR